MVHPSLYIFSGLPGVGKTTISEALATRIGVTHLRIDTIEQALRDLCGIQVYGEGYALAYRMAADNLRLGNSVIADSCNPIRLTRKEWQQTATALGAKFFNIEVICSDVSQHRQRVEERRSSMPELSLPGWQDVQEREYESWDQERIVVDTAGSSVPECLETLLDAIRV